MINLLNRGLNFTILPLKLDITQTLVDFRRFQRSTIWMEFWHGKEEEGKRETPLFKVHKTNLPKNYTTPQGLKTFLGAIKSEISDHRNRNSVKCNIPQEEIEALKDLIRIQKERKITIKACDKGSGIIILDFNEYMRACYSHLNSNQEQADGTVKNRFKLVHILEIEKAKNEINSLLNEARDNKHISEEEYIAMEADNKDVARFYCNFKVHKTYLPKTAPPPRAIVSGSGSITENISIFVQQNIKDISKSHQSYLEDTPAFLREIQKINEGPLIPENAMLVSLDVTGLYDNIPHDEGIECLGEALTDRKE